MTHFFWTFVVASQRRSAPRSPTPSVRIGLSVPRTGTYGWVGTHASSWRLIALADLNAKRGFQG